MKKSFGRNIIVSNLVVFWGVSLLTILISVISIFLSIILTSIIDNVLPSNNIEKLIKYVLFYVGVSIVLEITFFVCNYSKHIVDLKVCFQARKQIVDILLHKDGKYFIEGNSGEWYKIVVNDVEQICSFITNNFQLLIGTFCSFIGSTIYLLFLNWKLYVLILAIQPIMFIVQAIIMPKIVKISNDYHTTFSQVILTINELFANPIEAIISGCKHKMFFRMTDKMDKQIMKSKKLFVLTGISAHIGDFISTLTMCLVIGYGGYCIIIQEMTVGALIVFITYSQKNLSHIRTFVGFMNEYSNIRPIYEKINRLYMQQDNARNRHISKKLVPSIELRKVTFSYDDTTKVYDSVSFKFECGKKYGIIGKSGEGKSTLVKLLFGLWQVNEGDIYLGEMKCNQMDVSEISDLITYLSIDSPLINDTIFENLLLDSKENINEQDIINALKKAGIFEEISKMENGIYTMIGEGGSSLSAGQRQRILLARGFLSAKKIIVLDEPTSSLDENTKQLIVPNIYECFSDRTIIIITHDVSILDQCDEIVEVYKGSMKVRKVF